MELNCWRRVRHRWQDVCSMARQDGEVLIMEDMPEKDTGIMGEKSHVKNSVDSDPMDCGSGSFCWNPSFS